MAVGGSHTRCWRGGSTEAQRWVFAQSKQVRWQELVPFGILAGGWAREMVLVSSLVPHQTERCRPGAQQLPLPLSSRLPAFRSELLIYDLPDAKQVPLAVGTHFVWPLHFCKPGSGALLGRRAAPLPRLPPASPWSAHCLSALPTLFRGPLVCAWLRRLRSASFLVVFWVSKAGTGGI